MMERTCAHCQENLKQVDVISSTGGKVLLAKAPFKTFVSKAESSTLNAFACPACGSVQFFAEEPNKLL